MTDDRTVLKFRPRRLSRISPTAPGLPDYADGRTGPEAYRQRMMTNAAAFTFAVVLACIGVWLAFRLADLRTSQDCVLMGRKDCAHISSIVR